jgi:uncharacterized membrane protein
MRCESCGAQMPQERTTCEYCGSTWDRVVPASVAPQSTAGNVFDQIKRSAAWADRNSPVRQSNLPQMPASATVAPVIGLVVFIAVSGFIAFMALGMAGIFGAVGFSAAGPLGGGIAIVPAFMALVPVGFVVLGVFGILKHGKTMSDFRSASTMPYAAVVAGKRIQVSGGGKNSSASTSYFITGEFEDGRRVEFAVMTPGLYGKVTQGDAGILFVRGKYALDFDRIVV